MENEEPKTIDAMSRAWRKLIKAERESGHPKRIAKLSKAFNEMLDSLDAEDFFGTEGQHDPRVA